MKKYNLAIDLSNTDSLKDFLGNLSEKYTSSLICKKILWYEQLAGFYEIDYDDKSQKFFSLKIADGKKKLKKKEEIHFLGKVLFPRDYKELLSLIEANSMKVELKSSLLEKELVFGKIIKNEGRFKTKYALNLD